VSQPYWHVNPTDFHAFAGAELVAFDAIAVAVVAVVVRNWTVRLAVGNTVLLEIRCTARVAH
jgi:hypothetical protein